MHVSFDIFCFFELITPLHMKISIFNGFITEYF